MDLRVCVHPSVCVCVRVHTVAALRLPKFLFHHSGGRLSQSVCENSSIFGGLPSAKLSTVTSLVLLQHLLHVYRGVCVCRQSNSLALYIIAAQSIFVESWSL